MKPEHWFSAKFVCLALLNLIVVYLTYNGLPTQDESLVYGKGQLLNVDAATKEAYEALSKDAYAMNYVYNTRKCEYEDESSVQKLVFFFIVGNKGNVQQFQPIANSLFEYTQKVEKFKKLHTCTDLYVFDFKDEPSAFKSELFRKQADFVAEKVIEHVKHKNYTQINFVTHSIGTYVANLAMGKEGFPIETVQNIFALASTMAESPQRITSDIAQIVQEARQL